jgi:hypothetical protein
MIKVIGIGKAGANVLNYLKKQNFHILKEEEKEIEFIEIRNFEDYKLLKYDEKDMLYLIAGLGGETGTKYARLINKEASNLKVELKNIFFLPFSHEGKAITVNGFVLKQVKINPNIELFANDDLVVPKNRDFDELELLRLNDKDIFELINCKTPVKNSSFIIEKTVHMTKYKTITYFSPKHYKMFIIFPKLKLIANKALGEEIESSFGIIDKKYSITDLIDIEDIAHKALDAYLKETT